MFISRFVLKVINNEKKKFQFIIKTLIPLQDNKCRGSLKCANNQSFGFIRISGSQVCHLLIHLNSLTFVLQIYMNLKDFC